MKQAEAQQMGRGMTVDKGTIPKQKGESSIFDQDENMCNIVCK